MSRIAIDPLARAIATVRALSLKDKQRLCDEIRAEQPCLLASCLAQPRLGVSAAKLDVLLHILLVCYQAMKGTGLNWPRISEDEQERQLLRWGGAVQFSEMLEPDLSAVARSEYFANHPEQPLLAFVVNELNGWLTAVAQQRAVKESDKYVMAAAINLVQCIAYVPIPAAASASMRGGLE